MGHYILDTCDSHCVNSWMEHCILVYWSIHSDNSAVSLSSIGDSIGPFLFVCCFLFAVLGGRAVGHFPFGMSLSLFLRLFTPHFFFRISFSVRVSFSVPACLPDCCLYSLYSCLDIVSKSPPWLNLEEDCQSEAAGQAKKRTNSGSYDTRILG